MVQKHNLIDILLGQLRSGSFEPKKTACMCLDNIVKNNFENQNYCIERSAVKILCDLISDEEDDLLSTKAYECLEHLGPKVIRQLISQVGQLCEDRKPHMWKASKTIILDVFNKRERHIFAKKLAPAERLPSLRHFGPQDDEDLMD